MYLNNPLNIKHSAILWEGMSLNQDDKEIIRFTKPEYGIKAAYKILYTFNTKYHCKTLGQLISRWAPPDKNDTVTYIKIVCTVCKCPPETLVDFNDIDFMCSMLKAMCKFENGITYPDSIIKKGILLKNVKHDS